MAEAVGLTSAVVALVTTAYSSCQELYSTYDGVRNAPKHITMISNDLQDFYLVLGTIQALLDDEDFSAGIAQHSHSENLCKVLKDCIRVFNELSTIISSYQARSRDSASGTWQSLKWTFKESEVKSLQSDLMGCKASLNLAISIANCYNTHATHATSTRIEQDMATYLQELERLPEILEQLEDLKIAQLPQAAPHGAIDRAGIKIDYQFALRQYVDGAASIHSGIRTPSSPSFQVSDLETGSYQLTSKYYTAPISQASVDEYALPSRKCTQILVRNVGLHRTMAFQIVPEHTIGQIKSFVCERIGLENAEFELLHASRVLHSSEKSIDEYRIPHDATLTCVSFRPNHSPAGPHSDRALPSRSGKGSRVMVRIFVIDGKEYSLSIAENTLVRELKDFMADWRKCWASDIRLIFGGVALEDGYPLLEYGVSDESTIFMLFRTRALCVGVIDISNVSWRPTLAVKPPLIHTAVTSLDTPTGTESTLPENPKIQRDESTSPRNSKNKNISHHWLFRKVTFRVPRAPMRRIFYSSNRTK